MRRLGHLLAVATGSMLATGAWAQIHEGDIAVGINSGKLTVGTESDGMGVITEKQCVFGIELGSLARTTDPGYDTDSGIFVPDTEIAYFIRKALRKWDGSDFETIPAERVRISFGPVPGISTPLSDPAEPLEGVYVGTSAGEWHTHYVFRLELGGSPATGAASDGVYLLELELRTIDGGVGASDPFWLVIDARADQQTLVEAIAHAEAAHGCGDQPCLADVNGDGAVTPADFTAWINAYNSNLPECDQNGDGVCSPSDFTAWITNFNAGCDV